MVKQPASTNPAKIFGLYPRKGALLPGSDADLVIYDPERKRVISAASHHMDVDYSCYEGRSVQGGSDVGANAAVAVAAGDGTFRISGEKWFCSVADADQFLVTARPDGAAAGTGGLGCFVVPRRVDGVPNGFSIRRLKDKVGTRAMASAEIDFADAVAYPIGPTDAGFKTMVSAMLNASRWLNAIGDTGIMRRAYLEASGYAVHRTAFGSPIASFPAVRAALAGMKAEWLGSLHATWFLTGLDESVDVAFGDGAEPDPDDAAMHRFLVNGNKLVASGAATTVARAV